MVLQTNIDLASEQLVSRFSERVTLPDGLQTTVNFVRYNRAETNAHLVSFVKAIKLLDWCETYGYAEAMGGGYFLRKSDRVLGEARINGKKLPSVPFPSPWHSTRGSVHMPLTGNLDVAPLHKLPKKIKGDLLQAGPTLIHEGVSTFINADDPEGFSMTAFQHDEDINAKRHPRAAIGCSDEHIWTVSADGRSRTDAGLYLAELADIMLQLGVTEALNLDGGSSTSHVSDGQLLNVPRRNDNESVTGYPIHNAIIFTVCG
jgi:exopolysaccharide biosynthesis protein